MDIKINISDDVNASSSVPASPFGWDFQVNAAIVLMLKNIKQAKSVKVEGPTDDIEIYLESGTVIYSQAKAVFDTDDFSHVDRNLRDGLKTLYRDSLKTDVEHLIYITNSPNPFGNQKTMYRFSSGLNPYLYSALPSVCRKKIDEILKKKIFNIDTNKLSVYVLQFSKDLNNRYKVIKEQTNELINSFELGISDIGNTMLEIWQNEFFHNASASTTNIIIKKSEMLWPLVVVLCEFEQDDDLLNNFDRAIVEEIEHKYKTIINNKTDKFSFAIKVISSFDEYNTNISNIKERANSFISSCWMDYEDEFNFENTDNATKENVLKITLRNILNKRYKIGRIKEKTGL